MAKAKKPTQKQPTQKPAAKKITPTVLIINGPNLNMLGLREPDVYGYETLEDIAKACDGLAKELGGAIDFIQSNHEGEIIGSIHEAFRSPDIVGVIINAGAYTHTSIAIHDALKMLKVPIYEVHLSNVFAREAFRHHSYIAPLAQGVICGLGMRGYLFALHTILSKA